MVYLLRMHDACYHALIFSRKRSEGEAEEANIAKTKRAHVDNAEGPGARLYESGVVSVRC